MKYNYNDIIVHINSQRTYEYELVTYNTKLIAPEWSIDFINDKKQNKHFELKTDIFR